jgi:hypothetical protein
MISDTILTIDVEHKIIHKRSPQKTKRGKLYLKTIGLLLHMDNTRCILHIYSSSAEILKNEIRNF